MIRKNIWMNHWFSSAYSVVKLLKNSINFAYYVIGSSEADNSVMINVCDEWHTEPKQVSGSEYVDFCLDFCVKHNIDVFIPHRHFSVISEYKKMFTDSGIKVMIDDFDTVSLLNDKGKTYSFFEDKKILDVPENYVVRTFKEFEEAYDKLNEKYSRVCFKFIRDEGGKSYRLIDNGRDGYEALFKKQGSRITYKAVTEALKEKEVFSPIMIMPYLEGDEISVDCLKTKTGIIMIPRVKNHTRFETVEYSDNILKMCADIYDVIDIQCPCNIQFKYRNDTPYFLEINTRMSGGISLACLASGVNIPDIAVSELLGKTVRWTLKKEKKTVTNIETPIII